MYIGHIVRNSRKSAYDELYGSPEEVWCTSCNQKERLKVVDYGFGDPFGGVSDWEVVTSECEGADWEKAECGCCGESKNLMKPPEGWDQKVVCRECFGKEKEEG